MGFKVPKMEYCLKDYYLKGEKPKMNNPTVSYTLTILPLVFMILSSIWVMYDTRKRIIPWSETIAWGLFSFSFVGIGLIAYFFWRKKFYPLKEQKEQED